MQFVVGSDTANNLSAFVMGEAGFSERSRLYTYQPTEMPHPIIQSFLNISIPTFT